MLDLNLILERPDEIGRLLGAREPSANYPAQVMELSTLVRELKKSRGNLDELKRRRNDQSTHQTASSDDAVALKADIRALETTVRQLSEEVTEKNSLLPNVPDERIPLSPFKDDKIIVHTHSGKYQQANTIPDHLTIATNLGMLNFDAGRRASGSQFPYWTGTGAKLEWALINYCVDKALKAGFTFHLPPILVNESSMVTSGTFPKFRDQAYRIDSDGLVAVPTAEMAVVGAYQGITFKEAELPLTIAAYTPCFRREAGASGKRDRGLIRVHQFNKVELFGFATPENSDEILERFRAHAEDVITSLGLPFRTALLSAGDIGQQAAITYDIEAFIPTQGEFIEVSSVSSCKDYQARRGNIRFKSKNSGKTRFVHTLNGSALATPRLFAAIIENCYDAKQQSVEVPEALVPYMGMSQIK